MAGHQRNVSSLIWWPIIVTYVIALLYKKYIHCVSKNDTDVAHSNFNAHQPIFVIFCRDIAE